MSKQMGKNRLYTSLDEATDGRKVACALCHVIAVPRGIVSTRNQAASGDSEGHCPNCGHVHGRKNH